MMITIDLGVASFLSDSSTSIFSIPESTSMPEVLHCFSLFSSTSIVTCCCWGRSGAAELGEIFDGPGVSGEVGTEVLFVLCDALFEPKLAKRANLLRLI